MLRQPSQEASPAAFDKLAGELKGKDKVVFHCALSQVRYVNLSRDMLAVFGGKNMMPSDLD